MERNILTMREYLTDKFKHGLIPEYLELFPIKPYKMLEIGILNGEFMRWFQDTYKGSDVYGIDINPPIEGLNTFQINQNDKEGLEAFGKEHGKFDIIIEDASHQEQDIKNTYNYMWKFVKKGGIYIVEDWGVCYFPNKPYGDVSDFLKENGFTMICKDKLSYAYKRNVV